MKDGTNSKNTPSEEWKAKALKELGKILKPYNLTEKALVLFAGAITENNNLLFKTILHLTLPYCSSKKSLIAEITGKIEEAFSWEVDEKAPTEPTKWELLEDRVIYSYYAFSEAPEGEDVEIVKEFIKDFPEVTEVIKKDIIENFPDLKPVLEAPIEEWIYTWGTFTDLYELDFYGFREAHTGKLSLFDRNRRALFNGVAIIEPTIEGFCTRIDKETGYYIPPDIKGVAGVIGLDVFFTENELYAESVETVEKARYYFLASLYFLKAFNVLIDNIASMFDVEEVKIAKRDIAFIESMAEDFNKGVELLKKRIIQTDYEDEEYQRKKLAVLEDILFPINLALTDIPKSRLKTTINNLKDFKAFTEKELNPTRSLCVYEEDYYNETGLKEEDTDGEGA